MTTSLVFERALGAIRARVSSSDPSIAVAYSGGLDSAALLHLAHAYGQQHGVSVFAFHVHHGLSPNADAWLAHCQQQCALLGVAFEARHVDVGQGQKSGVEDAARNLRYAALGAMCRAHGVPLLLTAHHLDDQAETVLLQLLRGSGVAGLSGMDQVNPAPDLLGDASLLMARPLLTVPRSELEAYVTQHQLGYVEDESNLDPRYARNALRHQVMPALAQAFPGFQGRFARTAQHAQAAQRMLIELGAQDLAACLDGDSVDLTRLRLLSADRIDNMLRYWFGSRDIRMPSTAWLNEMRTQLLDAKHDAQLCVTHADCHIRRHRDHVYITPKLDPAMLEQEPVTFQWDGPAQRYFPEFGGTLIFEPAEEGIAAAWLREQSLTIRLRSGGERLKLAPNRPTKSLKYHFQASDIPAWERERLPVLLAGSTLLYVAGLGMDCHVVKNGGEPRVQLRWKAGQALS